MKDKFLPLVKKFALYIIVAIVTLLVYVFFIEQPIHDWMELRGYRKQIKANNKEIENLTKRIDTLITDKQNTIGMIEAQYAVIHSLESEIYKIKHPRKKPSDPINDNELKDAVNTLKKYGQ